MTFTKTPPQQPGFYLWRSCENDDRNFCGTVWKGVDEVWACIETRADITSNFGGEWCRLVPSEEVETAYREGYEDRTSFRQLESEDWNNSRAKRVAEGVE